MLALLLGSSFCFSSRQVEKQEFDWDSRKNPILYSYKVGAQKNSCRHLIDHVHGGDKLGTEFM